MILFLRGLFVVVLASMLWVTSWASLQCPLFAVPHAVAAHPWFIATLFDAYWGFITFFVWVAYRQLNGWSRLAWLLAILLLGNIAMASYCLAALSRAPRGASLRPVLTERQGGVGWLGPLLAVLGLGITAVAWHARSSP